jgi:hypothetical protein
MASIDRLDESDSAFLDSRISSVAVRNRVAQPPESMNL